MCYTRYLSIFVILAASLVGCLPEEEKSSVATGAAGRAIYLDDEGNRTSPPTGAALAGPPSVNRSTAGLTVQQNAQRGGGQMVELNGRFRSYSVATRGEDGRVRTECAQGLTHPGQDCSTHAANSASGK